MQAGHKIRYLFEEKAKQKSGNRCVEKDVKLTNGSYETARAVAEYGVD